MTQYARQATADSPLTILQQVTQQLQAQTQVEALVNVAAQALQAAFDFTVIWIALYDDQKHLLTGYSGLSPKTDAGISRLKLTVAAGTLFDQVLTTRQPLEIPNLQAESRADKWQSLAQTLQIQGTLLYPICYHQQVLGLVLLGSPRWGNNPRSEEVLLLSTFTTLLGTHLHTLQHQHQPQAAAPPIHALLQGLAKSTELDLLEDRIIAVLQHLHQALNPAHTSFYQWEAEQQLFGRQLTQQPRGKGRAQRSAKVEVGARENAAFFQALQTGQTVAVSDIHSFANSPVSNRWVHQLQLRSLLCTPILAQGKLLGFLALEGSAPRLWQDSEKQLLQGAAHIVGLHLRSQTGSLALSQSPLATGLLSALLPVMGQAKAWDAALQKSLLELCKRLQSQWAVLCQYHPESQQYIPRTQAQISAKQKGLELPLKALSPVDAQMLTRSTSAIAIGNVEEDLRFISWRHDLLALNLKGLMVANLEPGKTPPWLLMLGQPTARLWSTSEADQFQQIATELAPLLTQHQQLILADRYEQLTQLAHQGLQQLQACPANRSGLLLQILKQLYPTATPVLLLRGKDAATMVQHRLDPDPVASPVPESSQDPLLRQIRETVTVPYQLLEASQLQSSTLDWLALPHLQQLCVVPLHDPPEFMGGVLLSHPQPLGWSTEPLEPCIHLLQTFAHLYRTHQTLQHLRQHSADLESLNWYKQRQLEYHCQTIMTHYEHLYEVMAHITPRLSRDKRDRGTFALLDSMKAIETLLQSEGWQLRQEETSLALTTLLRRLLDRIDPITKSRQLWTKVHNQTQALTLNTAPDKLELILFELLLTACYRSQPGQNIDLWCRLLNDRRLEFAITDSGYINPQLLHDLQQGQPIDDFLPPTLEQVPGRHLRICQTMTQKLGGHLEIFQLEDGRTLSRMTLPLAEASGS